MKTILILSLGLLASCGTTTGYQGTNLLLNIPSYHRDLMEKDMRIKSCLAKKECTAKWSPSLQYWVVTPVAKEEAI